MDLCKSLLDRVLYTEVSDTVILYIFLAIFVFSLLFAIIFIKQKTEVTSNVPNVLRIKNAQNVILDTFLSDYSSKPKKTFMEVAEDLSRNEKLLVNFVPLTVTQPGFIGPSINGVFDEKNGVSQLVRAGIRSFFLIIDYHEEPSMKPPLYAEMNMPCLLVRDGSGTIRSLNSGSIEKTCQTLADTAFSLTSNTRNDPLLLTLYFVRTPDPVNDQKGFLRYCSQVAKELAPLTQYHLGQSELGPYTRQARQDTLLSNPLSMIEKKVLIFSNLDTTLFRTVKPAYQPKEDLDYWIHLRIFKDSENSLGVTKKIDSNQTARGIIDTTKYFVTIPPEDIKTKVTFLSQRWTTAVSDVGTNPAIDRLNLIMITLGVQSIPLSFVSMDSTEKEFLNVWIKSGWKLRPKAIRFAKDDDLKADVQSKEADANQGQITSPGL